MAQWENKEETAELTKVAAAATKTPTTLTLCINNCGLPGGSTTKDMCNSCFKASIALKEAVPSCSGQEKARSEPILDRTVTDRAAETTRVTEEDVVVVEKVRVVNRCAGCRRKVGLTGFRCRCGGLFCSEHRYSDRHNCGFDYKAAGREAIARENPVFKAAKIVRF